MRCLACNKILSDLEATRKSINTGEYLDLCSECLVDLDVNYTENQELSAFFDEEEILEEK